MTYPIGGGQPVAANTINDVTLGASTPSHNYVGRLWINDKAVPSLYYNSQYNLLTTPSRIALLKAASPGAVVSSQVQDTSLFQINDISVPTAHAIRLAIKYTLTGTGSPHSRLGLKINGTTVNNTTSGPGFNVETTNDGIVVINVFRRDGGSNMGFFHGDSNTVRLGTTASIPGAVITSLEVLAQMLGASRSLTAVSYKLWEFR